MAETKTADHIRMVLKAMDIAVVQVYEPDRTNKTIVVDVGSQEDATFVVENGINMKPQNVWLLITLIPQLLTNLYQMKVLESQRKPYVVYMDLPIKKEFFKVFWENQYRFLPELIHFSTDLRSAAFELDENQSSRVTKASVFKIDWRKVYHNLTFTCCVRASCWIWCLHFHSGASGTVYPAQNPNDFFLSNRRRSRSSCSFNVHSTFQVLCPLPI